ncbi:hypothetical protein GCM10009799_33800 [Nocardiopsis rhodophaea]|uniref:Thiocillin family RiPP n=1 Tax=Nocardiopsis rhodophaea TaxID=280238 RepID=A0ABN2TB21_9ACTN
MSTEDLISGYASYATAEEVAASSTVAPPASMGVSEVVASVAASVAASAASASVNNTIEHGC